MKVSKRDKKKYKKIAGIGAAIFGICVVCGVGIKIFLSPKEEIFCEGKDPSSGQGVSVFFENTDENTGHVRVIQQEGPSTKVLEDHKGLIYREVSGGPVSRVSLNIDEREHLQIYRECGKPPICRMEKIKELSQEQKEVLSKKIIAMEQATFEARKKTSLLSEKFSHARTEAIQLKNKLKRAKSKKDKDDLKKQFEKANAAAGDLAGQMQSLSAETFSMQKQTETQKKEQEAKITTTDLVPSQAETWCANTERGKMKF